MLKFLVRMQDGGGDDGLEYGGVIDGLYGGVEDGVEDGEGGWW